MRRAILAERSATEPPSLLCECLRQLGFFAVPKIAEKVWSGGDWSRERNVHALAVRAYRLPQVVELPMLESYGGCKSWVELANEFDTNGAAPVLPDEPFAQKLDAFQDALQPTAATPIDREGRPGTVPVAPDRHGIRPSRGP